MKTIKTIIVSISVLLIFIRPTNLLSNYTFCKATERDLPSVLELINTHAQHDNDKIVIVPKRFREMVIAHAIAKERLFVAKDSQGAVVGIKKLFLIEDKQELQETLCDEIRCFGTQPVQAGIFNVRTGQCIEQHPEIIAYPENNMYLYNGGDFTHPDHRKQGINSRLMAAALESLKEQISHHSGQAQHLILLYGLVHANAGQQLHQGRTSLLLKAFVPFAQQIIEYKPELINVYRYKAFMPTFDPEATECKPLPDTKAIAGFGCVIKYPLTSQE